MHYILHFRTIIGTLTDSVPPHSYSKMNQAFLFPGNLDRTFKCFDEGHATHQRPKVDENLEEPCPMPQAASQLRVVTKRSFIKGVGHMPIKVGVILPCKLQTDKQNGIEQ